MSLFKTKEWWRTQCGSNETFDKRSLLVAPLFGSDFKDVIIVTSHNGFLRIYGPSSQWNDEEKTVSGFKTTDLIIETQLAECIVDAKVGKFVSGSQDLRLAVLTPNKLVIYNATFQKGSTEHGDRCDIQAVYEHNISKFPTSLVAGSFGGARGRDFLCVQCLDGTLLFYEQETYAFSQLLRNRLLPEPLAYISRNDVFVSLSSAWILECYRYQNIAEFGRNDDKSDAGRVFEPDWSYNIGEAVLDIEVVTLSSFEAGVVVLGERNLFCLRDNCVSLKYTKRLEYNALCSRSYVIEPDGKLMVLVVADTNTLMIYEGTTLKWSAQLPFTPVSVARANFHNLDGALVILSEEGHLEVCYLGSEPSLFIAPPIHRRGFDYVAAEQELLEIRRKSKPNKHFDDKLSKVVRESELLITATASPSLEPCPAYELEDDEKQETERRFSSVCRVNIELSSYTALRAVQVTIDAPKPLIITKDSQTILNLCDRYAFETTLYAKNDSIAFTSEIRITASYETDRGELKVAQKNVHLPLKMLLASGPAENSTTSFAAIVKCLQSPMISFSQLFPEITTDNPQRPNSNALGLRHNLTGEIVTINSGATTNRYRIQSSEGLALALVIQQLLNRLRDKSNGKLATSLPKNYMQFVHGLIDNHFSCRQRVKKVTNELALLTTQLRNIERKILRTIRERNSQPLANTGLQILLDSTYDAIIKILDDLADARMERERAQHNLRCGLVLLLLLLRHNVNEDKYSILESAIGFEPQLRDDVGWEELADASLTSLLRLTSRKPLEESRSLTWNKLESARDIAKLKKRLMHAVERLDDAKESSTATVLETDAESAG